MSGISLENLAKEVAKKHKIKPQARRSRVNVDLGKTLLLSFREFCKKKKLSMSEYFKFCTLLLLTEGDAVRSLKRLKKIIRENID